MVTAIITPINTQLTAPLKAKNYCLPESARQKILSKSDKPLGKIKPEIYAKIEKQRLRFVAVFGDEFGLDSH